MKPLKLHPITIGRLILTGCIFGAIFILILSLENNIYPKTIYSSKPNKFMDYNTALIQLHNPETWCTGAKYLTENGDIHALLPLVQAYELPTETSKICLLDAMDALNAESAADQLFNTDNPQERRLAIHLMELFPHDSHLPLLEQALQDKDSTIRTQALRSLRLQLQTAEWERVMIRLLSATDEKIRLQVIESLARRRTHSAQQSLHEQLSREVDPTVLHRLQELLQSDRP